MKPSILAVPLVAIAACLQPPSPAQQAADFTATEQCVASHWGEPVLQLASDCLQNEVQATYDVIADVELLFEKATDAGAPPSGAPALPAVYASDSNVTVALARKRQAPPK